MKKLIIYLALINILSILMISHIFAQATDTEKKESIAKPAENPESTTPEQPKFFYDSKGKPDPMDLPWLRKGGGEPGAPGPRQTQPVVINVQEKLKNKLSGVVYCETNPVGSMALIGHDIVKVGDSVKIADLPKTAKITKINRKDIMLSYDGKSYPLKMEN